jgi:hypothetical protein
MYKDPFIDIDEWRDAAVRHRYVHGGFKGTELLFSFYFPPKEDYDRRFFQPLQAVSGNENVAPMAMYQASGVGFALESGGYLVESNQGSRNMFGGSAEANAAVADGRIAPFVDVDKRVLIHAFLLPERLPDSLHGHERHDLPTLAFHPDELGWRCAYDHTSQGFGLRRGRIPFHQRIQTSL